MWVRRGVSGAVIGWVLVTACNHKAGGEGSAVTTSDLSSTSSGSSTTDASTTTSSTVTGGTSDAETSSGAATSSTTQATASTSATTGEPACTPTADPPPPCRPGSPGPEHLQPSPLDRLTYSPALPWVYTPDPMAEPTTGAVDPEPDLGTGDECDIWAQDCPRGDKCMPWANDGGGAWNALKCTPVARNPGAPGEPCLAEGSGVSGVDDCELGAMCWDVDPETNEGICVAMCTCSEATPICDDPATTCVVANEGVLALCIPLCDPLDAPCPDGRSCLPQADGFVCTLDASGDGGQAGDPCEYLNVCDPGLMCLEAALVEGCQGALGCCAPYCDLDAPQPCPGPGESCVPYFEAGQAPQCLEDLGVCSLP